MPHNSRTIQINLVCPESGDLLPGDVRLVVYLQRHAEPELCDGEGGVLGQMIGNGEE